MDALSATTVPAQAAVIPAQVAAAETVPSATGGAPAAHSTHAEALPALPAAVQRTQLHAPEPKLMTREQMAALLALTT